LLLWKALGIECDLYQAPVLDASVSISHEPLSEQHRVSQVEVERDDLLPVLVPPLVLRLQRAVSERARQHEGPGVDQLIAHVVGLGRSLVVHKRHVHGRETISDGVQPRHAIRSLTNPQLRRQLGSPARVAAVSEQEAVEKVAGAAINLKVVPESVLMRDVEVVRADATSHTASLSNLRTSWYEAAVDPPTHAVGFFKSTMQPEVTVALRVSGCCPEPALRGFAYLGPEALKVGQRDGGIR